MPPLSALACSSPRAIEFGLPGLLLPCCLAGVLMERRIEMLWAIPLLFALNWLPILQTPHDWLLLSGAMGVSAILVALCMLMAVRSMNEEHKRFLPRYALHIFYPAHLAVLAGVHLLGVGLRRLFSTDYTDVWTNISRLFTPWRSHHPSVLPDP